MSQCGILLAHLLLGLLKLGILLYHTMYFGEPRVPTWDSPVQSWDPSVPPNFGTLLFLDPTVQTWDPPIPYNFGTPCPIGNPWFTPQRPMDPKINSRGNLVCCEVWCLQQICLLQGTSFAWKYFQPAQLVVDFLVMHVKANTNIGATWADSKMFGWRPFLYLFLFPLQKSQTL